MPTVPAPAVDLTLRVRYPLPDVSAEEAHAAGFGSVAEVVADHIEALILDTSELAELLENADVTYDFEIDAHDLEFEGGGGEWAPRDFHGLGEN